MYSNQQIVSIFTKDTLICATHAMQLMSYQMGKYSWTQEEWADNYGRYSELVAEGSIGIKI